MAEIKTRSNPASVDAFLDGVAHPGRQADSRVLVDMMQRVSGQPAS